MGDGRAGKETGAIPIRHALLDSEDVGFTMSSKAEFDESWKGYVPEEDDDAAAVPAAPPPTRTTRSRRTTAAETGLWREAAEMWDPSPPSDSDDWSSNLY